jgi:hypothetical protein
MLPALARRILARRGAKRAALEAEAVALDQPAAAEDTMR